jgi:hypothetical protein
MPNWCDNVVEITGPKESRDKLLKEVRDHADRKKLVFPDMEKEDLISLLQTFIPVSDYFTSMEGYNNGGYEWCLRNWGCKWPEKDVHIVELEDSTDLMFDTPWAPPLEGYYLISTLYPDLMFTHYYKDEGAMFMGIQVYQNGIKVFENEIDDSHLPELDDYEAYEEYFDNLKQDFFDSARKAISIG